MFYVFRKIYDYGLYIMHDLSLIFRCMRSVICFDEIGIVCKECCWKYFYIVSIVRLTLGIDNFKSSHSLSAGHIPLGLGRDKKSNVFLFNFYSFNI